jgi:hypothetical protein
MRRNLELSERPAAAFDRLRLGWSWPLGHREDEHFEVEIAR